MEWKIYDGGQCPKCGGDCEVSTVSIEKNWIYDDEEARCVKCGEKGYAVCDGEIADIIWDYENIESND